MPFVNDGAYDAACNYVITNGTRIDICSSEPGTYGAIAAASLGFKAGLTCTGPANSASGRKATVPAITDGEVTATNTATHWALNDASSILVATGALTAPQAVTDNNVFTLDAIIIQFADAT